MLFTDSNNSVLECLHLCGIKNHFLKTSIFKKRTSAWLSIKNANLLVVAIGEGQQKLEIHFLELSLSPTSPHAILINLFCETQPCLKLSKF